MRTSAVPQLCLNVARIPLFAMDFYNLMRSLCCSLPLGNHVPATVERETLRVQKLNSKSAPFS